MLKYKTALFSIELALLAFTVNDIWSYPWNTLEIFQLQKKKATNIWKKYQQYLCAKQTHHLFQIRVWMAWKHLKLAPNSLGS